MDVAAGLNVQQWGNWHKPQWSLPEDSAQSSQWVLNLELELHADTQNQNNKPLKSHFKSGLYRTSICVMIWSCLCHVLVKNS